MLLPLPPLPAQEPVCAGMGVDRLTTLPNNLCSSHKTAPAQSISRSVCPMPRSRTGNTSPAIRAVPPLPPAAANPCPPACPSDGDTSLLPLHSLLFLSSPIYFNLCENCILLFIPKSHKMEPASTNGGSVSCQDEKNRESGGSGSTPSNISSPSTKSLTPASWSSIPTNSSKAVSTAILPNNTASNDLFSN